MLRSLDMRQGGADTLAEHGYLDGPRVRVVLVGDEVETWRRDCRCANACGCWEAVGRRPATDEDLAAFADAQRPIRGRTPPPATPLHEALVRIAPKGQQELGLGGGAP